MYMSSEILEDNNVEKTSEKQSQRITELQEDLEEIEDKIDSGEINPKLKLPEQGEVVAEFIDSEGEKRKPSAEIALLGPEQIVVIDQFYREHDELADSVETMLGFAQDINSELQNKGPDGKYKALSDIVDPAKLQERLYSAKQSEANTENVQLTESERANLTKLSEEIAQLKAKLEIPLPTGDFKSVKEYIDAYYKTLEAGEMPLISKPGIMTRINSGAREASIQEIEAYRAGLQKDLDLRVNLANDQISQIIQTQLNNNLASFPAALFEPYSTGTGLEAGEGLDETNGPLQNEVCIIEYSQLLANYYQQFEYMHKVEANTLSVLQATEIKALLKNLTPAEISNLATKLSANLQKSLLSEHELIMNEMKAAATYSERAAKDSAEVAEYVVKGNLYQEKALADLYITDREQDIITKITETIKLINPASTIEAQKIIDQIKSPDFVSVSAASLLVHNSGFAREITASGELRTKQAQINTTGTLNETTNPGFAQSEEISTHSKALHFSDKLHHGYASLTSSQPGESGFLLIPIGSIVEHSPIDKKGMLLSVVASPDQNTGDLNIPNNKGDKYKDEVFFSSPNETESDVYSIPLDETTTTILIGGQIGVSQAERGGTVYTVDLPINESGAPDVSLSTEIPEIIRNKILPRISENPRIKGKKVVPIRRAPLDFEPEIVDDLSQLRGNRFRKKNEKIETTGVNITRAHIRDRQR